MLRGNNGDTIFADDPDLLDFEYLVADTAERFDHRVHAYCWMPNHVHMVLQVGADPLSRIIQNLAGRYTRRFNKRHGRIGHLFQGRFRSILVDADSYLLELVRYVHLNPVRAGLANRPRDWRWSGHNAYAGVTDQGWLTTDWVLSQFAPADRDARHRYLQFMGAEVDMPVEPPGELADDTLKKWAPAEPVACSAAVDPETVLTATGAVYGLRPAELASAGRQHHLAEARSAAALLATELGAASLTDLAGRLNRDVATLSNGVRRLRERLPVDGGLAERVDAIRAAVVGKDKKAKA